MSQAVDRKHKKRAPPLSARVLYTERNRLVAALSGLFPAHLMLDPAADEPWANLVCIHLPAGTVTWHIPPWDMPFFTHLAYAPHHWDGHTTEEKYDRVQALAGTAAPAGASPVRPRPIKALLEQEPATDLGTRGGFSRTKRRGILKQS